MLLRILCTALISWLSSSIFGQVILEEHFENNNHNWRELISERKTIQVIDGVYRFENLSNKKTYDTTDFIKSINIEKDRDFEMSISAKGGMNFTITVSDSQKKILLEAHILPWMKKHSFQLFESKEKEKHRFRSSNAFQLARSSVNDYLITKKGNSFFLWINKHLVASINDVDMNVDGFMFDLNQGKQVVEFDDLMIRYTDNISEYDLPDFTANTNDEAEYSAIFISINDYRFSQDGLVDLNNPNSDAKNLENILKNKYRFNPAKTLSLVDPDRDQIIDAFEEMSKLVDNNDYLLIFYAGHGIWDEKLKVGYWLPADAKINSKANWISNSTVRDYISGINSKHTLLISDACFSGGIFKTRSVSDLNTLGAYNLSKLPSRKAMTSGNLSAVPDESKFMNFLLKRLEENNSKYISAGQLFYSLREAVINNSMTTPQFGIIQGAGDEGGDFIFSKKQ